MRFSHILIIIVALTAFGCKSDEPKASAEKENFENIFNKAFGMPNSRHRWNFAQDVNIHLLVPDRAESVAVYCKPFNQLLKVAELKNPDPSVDFTVNVPADVTTLDVVVDWRLYHIDVNDANLDTRAMDGESLITNWTYFRAPSMGWIMAADSPVAPDFDFNDVVARFVQDADGNINITALACGTPRMVWLHYFDGQTDYIVTPRAANGYCIKTSEVRQSNARSYAWLQWFGGNSGYVGLGTRVNVAQGGVNHIEGATVKFPLAVTNDYFSASLLSESTFDYDDKGMQYPRPILGFYVTEGVYDYRRKSELWEEIEDVEEPSLIETIMCIWPKGSATNMFVIPDVSELDKDEAPVGWQWPTEGSQIDYVYPYFKNWVRDASYNWFSVTPGGWPGHSASKDAEGNFVYFGYYQR